MHVDLWASAPEGGTVTIELTGVTAEDADRLVTEIRHLVSQDYYRTEKPLDDILRELFNAGEALRNNENYTTRNPLRDAGTTMGDG